MARKLDIKKKKQIKKLLDKGWSVQDIALELETSPQDIYYHINSEAFKALK